MELKGGEHRKEWPYCDLVFANFTHILQGYFTGAGAIVWLPQYQWSNPEGYG